MKGSCDDIRPWLDAYFDGELATLDARRMERHLEACADCRRSLEEIRALDRAIRAVAMESEPTAEHLEELARKFEQRADLTAARAAWPRRSAPAGRTVAERFFSTAAAWIDKLLPPRLLPAARVVAVVAIVGSVALLLRQSGSPLMSPELPSPVKKPAESRGRTSDDLPDHNATGPASTMESGPADSREPVRRSVDSAIPAEPPPPAAEGTHGHESKATGGTEPKLPSDPSTGPDPARLGPPSKEVEAQSPPVDRMGEKMRAGTQEFAYQRDRRGPEGSGLEGDGLEGRALEDGETEGRGLARREPERDAPPPTPPASPRALEETRKAADGATRRVTVPSGPGEGARLKGDVDELLTTRAEPVRPPAPAMAAPPRGDEASTGPAKARRGAADSAFSEDVPVELVASFFEDVVRTAPAMPPSSQAGPEAAGKAFRTPSAAGARGGPSRGHSADSAATTEGSGPEATAIPGSELTIQALRSERIEAGDTQESERAGSQTAAFLLSVAGDPSFSDALWSEGWKALSRNATAEALRSGTPDLCLQALRYHYLRTHRQDRELTVDVEDARAIYAGELPEIQRLLGCATHR